MAIGPRRTLTAFEAEQLAALHPLYTTWNARINVVSRKDMEHFEERHVLHALGIAAVHDFQPGERVLDIGTGGGFPGIPLAILFPETEWILCDSIGKKIKVVSLVRDALELHNVTPVHARAEELKMPNVDFVVSRAVTRLQRFMPWATRHLKPNKKRGDAHAVLYLKGGDLTEELAEVANAFDTQSFALSEAWPERPFFETKQVVFVRGKSR